MRSIRAFKLKLFCVYSTLAMLATLIRHSPRLVPPSPEGRLILNRTVAYKILSARTDVFTDRRGRRSLRIEDFCASSVSVSLPLGEGGTSHARVTDEGSEQSERAIYTK